MPQRVLLINGSPSAGQGNTALVLRQMAARLQRRADVATVVLADMPDAGFLEAQIRTSQGFVFATGTYWDSWGSPLQRCLESLTSIEASDAWLGKPAAVLVTMHSVGGKAVLSRLQGVLNTLGLLIPPLTGWVYSAAAQAALQRDACGQELGDKLSQAVEQAIAADLWRLADLEIVAHNLLEALEQTHRWKAWPVDRAGFDSRWVDPG
jgi:chromate reductase